MPRQRYALMNNGSENKNDKQNENMNTPNTTTQANTTMSPFAPVAEPKPAAESGGEAGQGTLAGSTMETGPSTDKAPEMDAVTEVSPLAADVISNKTLRKEIDDRIQLLKALPSSRERSLAITKLQEAVMWLGMDLKRLNEPNPYPNSMDPSNTKIDATADGLKL